MAMDRLTKKQHAPLLQKLGSGRDVIIEQNGLLVPKKEVEFDFKQLESLFHYIIKGLMYHHWKVPIVEMPEYFICVSARPLYEELKELSNNWKWTRGNLGDGIFQYEGTQSPENQYLSCWRMSVYDISVSENDQRVCKLSLFATTAPCYTPALVDAHQS